MGHVARILVKLSFLVVLLCVTSRAHGQGEDSIPSFPGDPVPLSTYYFATVTGALTHHVEQTMMIYPNPLPPGTYRIHVQSGGGTTAEINSVDTLVVRMNGVIAGTTADLFNQTYFTRVMEPDGQGPTVLLEVDVGGSPGAFVTVSIHSESAPSSAPPIMVFGPQLYTRTTSATTTDTHQFAVPAEALPPYYVHMQNGTSPSQPFPTGTVTLNGTPVLVNKIHEDTATATQQVTLQSSNTLAVTLKGKNNQTHSMSLWITATDSTPPSLTVTAPAEGAVTRDSVMVVTGTASDYSGVNVRVNGIAASTGSSGTFRAVVPLPNDGANTLTIVATDAVGLSTTVVRNVVRDHTAPVLTITSPADLLVSSTDSVLVAGTVTDPSEVTVNANGMSLPVGQGGAFSGMLGLTSGLNVITITAADAAGNTSSVVRQVTFDNVAPELTLSSPADSTLTQADSVLVSGVALDAGPVTVLANSLELAVGVDGAFLGYVMLDVGSNTITITATDGGGNTTTVTRTIVRDTAAPALALNGPSDNMITAHDTVTVHGTVTDQSSFELTVNGTPVAVASNGSFAELVTLAEGTDTILVVATDAAGNSDTVQRTVVSDGTSPVLVVTAPQDSLLTRLDSTTVNGTVSDVTAVSVSVNGSAATVTGGAYTADVALADGVNTITIVATDAAANESTVTRTVIRDATPPVLVVTAPADSTITSDANVSVTGTASDDHAITLTVSGSAVTPATDGSFAAPVVLAEGANTIHVVATDAAGNESTRDVFIRLDTSAPSVLITTPADGLITKADSVSVSGTAMDATALSLTVNGIPVGVDGAGAFSTMVALGAETNIISVIADDEAGNRTTITRTVTRDTIAPIVAVTTPADNTTLNADSVTVTGSVSDAHAFTLTINSVAAAIGTGGSFSQTIGLIDGPNAITLVASDTAGNTRTTVVNVTRQSVTVPPDPTILATPINPTITTSILDATAFLYTGEDAVQTGVVPGTMKPLTVAVLRGRVLDREGNALPGAEVTVVGHPEFGKTYSRADGRYDMAVNGGGVLVVNMSRSGYLPAQRNVDAPWRDYLGVDDVRLVQLDTAATVISFADPIEVARGSAVTDADGSRQATLMFKQGTTASMVMPDGTTQPLSTITVRATEYTVGPHGRESMPASLPPTTAYTYAAEFSVDEAQQAGAREVRFSDPVAFYIENFMDYTVGTGVPVGYYDAQKAAWVPSPDGRIVKVLSIENGSAVLDVDGSGAPASSTALAALGITVEELARLGTLYAAEQSLWRVAVTHFSAYDTNWGGTYPEGATPPNGGDPGGEKNPCGDKTIFGSIIGCESQTLGEVVPLTGTPFSLHYSTDRTPGYLESYTINIPLSGSSVPLGLKAIELEIRVAGQVYTDTFPASPNLSTSYTWDGKDAYGRTLQGRQPIRIRTGFMYESVALVAGGGGGFSFGAFSGVPMDRRGRGDFVLSKIWDGYVGPFDARGLGLGGWFISAHHAYDPSTRILYKGDGTWRAPSAMFPSVTTVAGTGVARVGVNWDDGLPATQVQMQKPVGVAAAPDGSFFFSDVFPRIRSVSASGIIGTLAGTGVTGFSGDGGPASAAQFNTPRGLAVGPDGSVYIADRGNHRIRKVAPDGIITTFAGSSSVGGFAGDDGPADEARLNNPESVAVTADGTVYISDQSNYRIRRVAPNGIITTVAGNGTSAFVGDGIPAKDALVFFPHQIAVAPDGSVYFSDHRWIRKIGTNGIITTFAGDGSRFQFAGDGGPARNAKIHDATGVAVAPDGSVYITDNNNQRVRRIGSDGIITTVAGNGQAGQQGDNGNATQAQLNNPYAVAVQPDGSVLIADLASNKIRAIAPALPGISNGDMVIASEGGSTAYVLDTSGRHLRTLHALTADTLLSFGYDAQGLLTTMTDADNNVTTIERVAGVPTAIAAPFGQRTTIAVDADGFVQTVQNPNAERFDMTYHTDGLLATFTDPRRNSYEFTYDERGKLARDDDPAGGFKTLTPFKNGAEVGVTVATAEGTATKYSFEKLPTRALRQVTVRPDGLSEVSTTMPNDSIYSTSPDGMVSATVRFSDPRFGASLPLTSRAYVRTPGGLVMSMTSSRKTVLSQPGNPFSVTSIVDTTIVNGQAFTNTYDAAQRQFVARSPLGRQSFSRIDAQGKLLERQVTGITPVSYGYDALGRIDTISQGTRSVSFTYDLRGRRATAKDALGRIESYFYDDADRIIRQVLANGREINFLYDANGNLRSITPPSRPEHEFDHTAVDLTNSYAAPALGAGEVPTQYSYNLDRQLTEILRPDSSVIAIAYDSAGRPSIMTIPGATYHTFYSAATGNVDSLTARGVGLRFAYDGALLKRVTWAGPVSGSVGVVYDNSFRIVKQDVNNADTVSFGYDNDGLLTAAGGLTIGRNPQNGLLTGTTLGSVETAQTYTLFGELNTFVASYAGANLLQFEYGRDAVGRITRLVETRGANRKLLEFVYDSIGQLTTVSTDSVVTTVYEYDANGNRIKETDANGAVIGTVDAQDRLSTNGAAVFGYTAAGDLKERVVGQDTTRYTYDAAGNLTSALLADGSVIEYTVDGANRRIAKSVDGVAQQRWLYVESRIVAELDSVGQVTSRFIYGTRANTPDYMVKAGQTYRYVTDHLGSVRLVVGVATGVVAQELVYDAYGDVLTDSNAGFQPFAYAGGLYDEATKLTRFGARDYDASTGRWTTKDPIGFNGGQPNLYAYVQNNPTMYIDPSGRCSTDPDEEEYSEEECWKAFGDFGVSLGGDLLFRGGFNTAKEGLRGYLKARKYKEMVKKWNWKGRTTKKKFEKVATPGGKGMMNEGIEQMGGALLGEDAALGIATDGDAWAIIPFIGTGRAGLKWLDVCLFLPLGI